MLCSLMCFLNIWTYLNIINRNTKVYSCLSLLIICTSHCNKTQNYLTTRELVFGLSRRMSYFLTIASNGSLCLIFLHMSYLLTIASKGIGWQSQRFWSQCGKALHRVIQRVIAYPNRDNNSNIASLRLKLSKRFEI